MQASEAFNQTENLQSDIWSETSSVKTTLSDESFEETKYEEIRTESEEMKRECILRGILEVPVHHLHWALLPVHGNTMHELIGDYYTNPQLSEKSYDSYVEPKITQNFKDGDLFKDYRFDFCSYSREQNISSMEWLQLYTW